MQLNIRLDNANRIAKRYRAMPKQISRARRNAVNRAGSTVRRKRVIPTVKQRTGVKAKTLRRTIELKRAGRRRDFALVRARYIRIPPQLWGQWRIRPIDAVRAVVEVFNGVRWVAAYAFANPSARSGAPVPLARYSGQSFRATDPLEGQRQFVDLRSRDLIIVGGRGPSLRDVFADTIDQRLLKITTDQLQFEFDRALSKAIR